MLVDTVCGQVMVSVGQTTTFATDTLMTEPDASAFLTDLIDRLVPTKTLDAYEAVLYLYLVRESHFRGVADLWVSVNKLGARLNMTRRAIEPRLRSLHEHRCIEVLETGWRGTRIRVALPTDVLGPVPADLAATEPDIEGIDVFRDERYRLAIMQRESQRCFYCLRSLSSDNWSLDHVSPQSAAGGNSYRNVVAACHTCNSSKGTVPAEDFLRGLYRRGRLAEAEFDARLAALQALRDGELVPTLTSA